jgi:hydrogenase nickel incorporation protein HypA/HybF
VGELAGVEVDLLRTAWELVRERSVAAEAELEVESVPARWTCSGCDAPMLAALALRCESCGAPARLSTGGELLLARVEMEVA